MAGILAHARGMIAVLAPTVNSYKRLVPGYEAPTYLTWGRTNRSALIRVPMVSPGRVGRGDAHRGPLPRSVVQHRTWPSRSMLAAGLDGVEKGLKLADPVEESLFEMNAARIAEHGIKELPGTLGDALEELEPRRRHPRRARRARLRPLRRRQDARSGTSYRTQVTSWEIERYLDAF